MTENNPFLFVHLPLDGIRNDSQVLDVSANRRHGLAHHVKIVADDTFGACLQFTPRSHLKFPFWKLNPAVFLPWAPNNSPARLTFTLWLSPDKHPGEATVIDAGLRKDLQRLKVRFRRDDPNLSFTVQAPAELNKIRGFCWTAQPTAAHGTWAHFAMVWDPKGEGASAGYGACRMFLDGATLAIIERNEGEEPPSIPSAGPYDTFLGSPTFSGRLAHFRIHTRELTQQDIAQEIDKDLARTRKADLLECRLRDPLDRPMLLLSASMGEKMTVAVKTLHRKVTLPKLIPESPKPDKCHFELRFRPGVLNLSRNVERVSVVDATSSWVAKTYPPTGSSGHVSVCIKSNSEIHLDENKQLKIVLDSLMADERFGQRWTRIDLRYQNVVDDQRNPHSGSIPQWLLLSPREPRHPAALVPAPGWAQDPGTTLTVGSGKTFIHGRLVAADAQDMMKLHRWGPQFGSSNQNFPYLMVADFSIGYAPLSGPDIKYTGRARWLSNDPEPKTLWSSDLCVRSSGLGINADSPLDVHQAVRRIEVNLDGVSYASEESVMKANET